MRVKVFALVLAVILIASPFMSAAADDESARICRGTLTPIGQQMYDAVAPHVRADSKLKDLMRKHVKDLVLSGRISRIEAQSNAPAVGACLRKLQT